MNVNTLVVIAKKNGSNSNVHEHINKIWPIYTMEYYSIIMGIKCRYVVLMNLENIMLSEQSQSLKTTYYMISL